MAAAGDGTGFLDSWRHIFPGCAGTRSVPRSRPVKGTRLETLAEHDGVDDSNFQVGVRVRPPPEADSGRESSLEIDENVITADRSYRFHHVLASGSTQAEVYESLCQRLVLAVLDGINSTLFVYGQTGSGKTHTMGGLPATASGRDRGLIPRVVEQIFEALPSRTGDSKVHVSFLQIYLNDAIYDLLMEPEHWRPLRLREDMETGPYVEDLSCHEVTSPAEVFEFFQAGSARRTTGSTKMNDTSSRAHAILILTLTLQRADGSMTVSKLHLADLAGSERAAVAGISGGVRFEESKAINSSLLVLSRVISALTERGGEAAAHVPYRDSTLTMMLRSSLGGNCKTTLLACLREPFDDDHIWSESVRTLRFAARASFVNNKAVVNECDAAGRPLLKAKLEREAAERERSRLAFESAIEEAEKRGLQPDAEGKVFVETCAGLVGCRAWGDIRDSTKQWILLLHGSSSDCTEFHFLLEPMLDAGYRIIGIDQPGHGLSSALEAVPTNSSKNLEKGGPVDVVIDVLNAAGVRKLHGIFGYDWGGSIALSTAIRSPGRVGRLVLFHSVFNEQGTELDKVVAPVLLLWVKVDQWHPVAAARKLARRLKHGSLVEFDVGKFDSTRHRHTYAVLHSRLAEIAVNFFVNGTRSGSPAPAAANSSTKRSRSGSPAPAATDSSKRGSPSGPPAPASKKDGCSKKASVAERGKPGAGERRRGPARNHTNTTGEGSPAIELLPPETESALAEMADLAELDRRSDVSSSDGAMSCDEFSDWSEEEGAAGESAAKRGTALSRLRALAASEDGVSQAAAVGWMRQAFVEGWLPRCYAVLLGKGGDIRLRPSVLRVLGALPVLSPESVTGSDVLVGLGLWEQAPRGEMEMRRSPRYFAGRNVCVKLPRISPLVRDGLQLADATDAEGFRTPAGELVAMSDDHALVRLPHVDATRGTEDIEVPLAEVLRQNQPLSIPQRDGFILLEDGVRAGFQSVLMRARMCEIALALEPLVSALDFGDIENTIRLQEKAVQTMRRHLNMTCLYDGVDRRRFARDLEVDKLITFGQGHCHGLTGCMASVLLVFSAPLGLDVRYTAGFSVRKDDAVANAPERHQWLEVTYRPSMQSRVVDLVVAQEPRDTRRHEPRWLGGTSLTQAYPARMYANGRLVLGCTPVPLEPSDVHFA